MSDPSLHDVAAEVLQKHRLTEVILALEGVVDACEQELTGRAKHGREAIVQTEQLRDGRECTKLTVS